MTCRGALNQALRSASSATSVPLPSIKVLAAGVKSRETRLLQKRLTTAINMCTQFRDVIIGRYLVIVRQNSFVLCVLTSL
ncbi:hypothetical protein NDU88_002846 [Pleurodeles waltl]|uniref:Uncharacterized protein n=1 Tax=Pleurodeles waltl TaxID=8319 RepID=A0AAV7QB25_PLEWA|nr:hypothetical protein NDU88_002846 [Pleurodeles waltl]